MATDVKHSWVHDLTVAVDCRRKLSESNPPKLWAYEYPKAHWDQSDHAFEYLTGLDVACLFFASIPDE